MSMIGQKKITRSGRQPWLIRANGTGRTRRLTGIKIDLIGSPPFNVGLRGGRVAGIVIRVTGHARTRRCLQYAPLYCVIAGATFSPSYKRVQAVTEVSGNTLSEQQSCE